MTTLNENVHTGSHPHSEERPQRQTQVVDWMDRLRVGLQRADDIHKQLEERLTPILRTGPSVAGQVASAKDAEETLVQLAADVRTFVFNLDRLSDQYQTILDRLEL